MRNKISEKNLLAGIILLAIGLTLLMTTNLFASPVRISEKGLFYYAIAFFLLMFSVRSFKRSTKGA